jgi:hypothetical protein
MAAAAEAEQATAAIRLFALPNEMKLEGKRKFGGF